MTAEDAEQDKSEQPSSFKLDRARRKGVVARGMDLGFLTSLSAFTVYVWLKGDLLLRDLLNAQRKALAGASTVNFGSNELLAVTGGVIAHLAQALGFLFVIVFCVVLVFELIQTGVVFSTEPLKLDFNRLNPTQNLKRLFTPRLLIETGKNVIKLATYAALAWILIDQARKSVASTATDARTAAHALSGFALRLLTFFAGAALMFAVVDQLIVRSQFLKKMRMSRRELRREVRDREGEPRLKQKRKQLHAEFVKQSKSLKGIRGADLLITNPTHFAVALRYRPEQMDAPLLVARGADHLAKRLKRLAFIYGVVVVEERTLAQLLYRSGELDQPIPSFAYQAVADLYLRTRRTSSASLPGQAHA